MKNRCGIAKYCSLQRVSGIIALSVITSTSAFANSALDTGIQADLDDVRAMYNNANATAFLAEENGQLIFEIPFPARAAQFTLSLVEISTGNVLLQNVYEYTENGIRPQSGDAIESSVQDYPEIEKSRQFELQASTQLDVSGLASDTRSSDFPKAETIQDAESDFLANVTASWLAQNGRVNAELEAVHRSNPENAVRYNGPRADLARMASGLSFQGPVGSSFNLLVGDVSVESTNDLVNSGVASRGFVVGYSSPNERFSWSVGRLFGHDIVGTVRGPLGISNESYRIATNYKFNVVNSDRLTWDLSLTNLRAKRTTDDDFSIGASNSGERNNVWGASSQFGFMDGRVNLSFSFARSRYDNPTDLNVDNIPTDEGLEVFNPGATSGSAYRHTVSWEVYRDLDSSRSLSFEYGTESADPFYRSIHGQSTADRRQWSLFSSFNTGMFNMRLGTVQYQNNLDNLISIHTLDEAVHQAEVSIDLSDAGEAEEGETSAGVKWAMPSVISLTASVQDLKTVNGEVIILAPVIEGFDFMNQTTDTYGISATWDGSTNSTSVDISYSFLDIDQRERASADRRDLSYGISHSYNSENWSLSGNVTFNVSDDLDSVSRSRNDTTQWGLSWFYASEGGLNWTASVDSGSNTLNYLLSDELEDSESNSLSFSLDFGRWLARKLSLGVEPSSTVRWQRSESESRSTFYSNDQVSESVSFNVGVAF